MHFIWGLGLGEVTVGSCCWAEVAEFADRGCLDRYEPDEGGGCRLSWRARVL